MTDFPNPFGTEFGDAICGTLKAIQTAIDEVEVDDATAKQLTTQLVTLQEAPLAEQAVFLIRLLMNYLNEDTRREILNGYVTKD